MAYDIYGYDLRRGYCEVHPHVQQEYPCDLCYAQNKRSNEKPKIIATKRSLDTIRVVIDMLVKRIPISDLNLESLDIDFGEYLIQIQKQNDTWKVTNAMSGHGYNCFDEFKDFNVYVLTDK